MRVLVLSFVPTVCWKNALNLYRAGHEVFILTGRGLTGLQFFPFLSGYKTFDTNYKNSDFKESKFLYFVNAVCGEWHIDMLLPVEVDIASMVWRVKDKLKYKCIPLYESDRRQFITDKWNFYNLLVEARLPTPKSILVNKLTDLNSTEINFPIIAKPPRGADSHGIKKIENLHSFQEYIDSSECLTPILVQEYIPGEDIVAALLVDKGKVHAWIIHNFRGDPPVRVFLNTMDVLELATSLVNLLEYEGVCVIDLRRDRRDNSLKIIEINARFGGSELHYANVGVNLSDLAVRLGAGEDISNIFSPVDGVESDLPIIDKLLGYLAGTPREIVNDLSRRMTQRIQQII